MQSNLSQSEYLFVYGSLKRDYEHPLKHFLEAYSTFLAEVEVPGKMYIIDWYPGAKFLPDSSSVIYGEVFKLNNEDLFQALDDYEGIYGRLDDEYERVLIPIDLNGVVEQCWMYNYIGSLEEKEIIASGRFP